MHEGDNRRRRRRRRRRGKGRGRGERRKKKREGEAKKEISMKKWHQKDPWYGAECQAVAMSMRPALPPLDVQEMTHSTRLPHTIVGKGRLSWVGPALSKLPV